MTAEYRAVIIGAGAAGIGVALGCLSRGDQNICVIDSGGVGQGASGNSLRIMHGGFRYLQSLDIPRTLHSIAAVHELLVRYPEDIQLLESELPLRWGSIKNPIAAAVGGYLYRLLAYGRIPAPRVVGTTLRWTDGQIGDPIRFHRRLVTELQEGGATVIENARVDELHFDTTASCWRGRSGEHSFTATTVVNCAAVNYQEVRSLCGVVGSWEDVPKWVVGYNLLLKAPVSSGVARAYVSSSGRLYFHTPRPDGCSALGLVSW